MPSTDSEHPDLRPVIERLGSEAGTDLFAEQFFSLDPRSATLVTRDQLRAALPMREQLFRSIGVVGTQLATLSPQWLDDQHVIVSTTWDVAFDEESGAAPLVLRSTYLLRRSEAGGEWEALVYLNHQDIRQVIGERQAGAAGAG